ncbi:MAG TPA: sugar transferase [Candidatus Dormibacteraeota bacterium]|nr:sugar transferase [Candidatus Dormibacteraeota bacterium]
MSGTRPTHLYASRQRASVSSLWWKRPFDVVLGTALLLIALPVILCLALAVELEDGGPAFFAQERVGLSGRRFRMWKLRTMHAGCEQVTHRRTAANWFTGRADGSAYKTLADPRITRVGRLLRRFDLDELPQLLNVMTGDMSLVGPRPAIPYELEHYEPVYFRRLAVPPGMTGLWQVSSREQLSAAEMMDLDLRYVREVSPWLDLQLLARTGAALVAAVARRD